MTLPPFLHRHVQTMISKSRFRTNAAQYFRRVERTGKPLVITDRGVPVLQLVRYPDVEASVRALRRSVVKYSAPLKPVGDGDWMGVRVQLPLRARPHLIDAIGRVA